MTSGRVMPGCVECGLPECCHGPNGLSHAFVEDHPCLQCYHEQATPGDQFCSDSCRDEYDRQYVGLDDGGEA